MRASYRELDTHRCFGRADRRNRRRARRQSWHRLPVPPVARRQRRFITEQEKRIVAYLLAKNQTVITAGQDGGNAVTLISRGLLIRALRPGQVVGLTDVPFLVPDHIWDELASKRDSFPCTPAKR